MENFKVSTSKSASSAEKRQTRKVGVAGSFQNQMMGNNATEPEIDGWATILRYTDREVWKVKEISKNGRQVIIQSYAMVADNDGQGLSHGHQNWKLVETEVENTLVWRQGKWRIVSDVIIFTDKFLEEAAANKHMFAGTYLKKTYPDLAEQIYAGNIFPQNVVAGITKAKKEYSPVSIIFGVCDPYYDWEF